MMMFLSRFACAVPESVGRVAAVGLGMIASRVWLPERVRLLETIDRVYHRKRLLPPRPVPEIIDRLFVHFALVAFESLRFPVFTTEQICSRTTFHGEEHLKRAMARGKGVILAVPHLGSWEMLGAAIAHRGYPLHSFYLAQKENDLGSALDFFRTYSNVILHDRDRGGLGALKALRKGEILGMIADQDGGNHGVYLDFLGHWVSMPAGPANWSLKLGSALVPLFGLRRGRSTQYDAWFFPAIDADPEVAPQAGSHVDPQIELQSTPEVIPEDTHENRVIARTKCLTAMTESWILQHPDQYLWFYDRFKPRHHAHVAALKASGSCMRGGGAVYRPAA